MEEVLAVLCKSPPPPPGPHLTPLPRSPSSRPDLKQEPAWAQVLELTQGQQVEKEVLAVLVHQLTEGRQKSGLHGQDTPSEHSTPASCLHLIRAFPSAHLTRTWSQIACNKIDIDNNKSVPCSALAVWVTDTCKGLALLQRASCTLTCTLGCTISGSCELYCLQRH